MAQWLSYLDDDAPVEIVIAVEDNRYVVTWVTGRDDEATGDYVRGQRAVGSLQEAVQLATDLCTE